MPQVQSKPKLSPQLKTHISKTVIEVLNDPDFGLELTERAKERLRRATATKPKTISLNGIKKKYL